MVKVKIKPEKCSNKCVNTITMNSSSKTEISPFFCTHHNISGDSGAFSELHKEGRNW